MLQTADKLITFH